MALANISSVCGLIFLIVNTFIVRVICSNKQNVQVKLMGNTLPKIVPLPLQHVLSKEK
jgi:hypothetical protein